MAEQELTPQQALAMQKEQCIFCQIISGQRPGYKVYEDDLVLGIMDIAPASRGHVILMPKEHYPIMPMVPESVLTHTFKVVKGVSHALLQSMLVGGTNVFIANGGHAGQQIPHFMVHIIPRSEGDNVDVFSLGRGSVDISGISEMQKALAGSLDVKMQDKLAEQGLLKESKVTEKELFEIIEKNKQLQDLLVGNIDNLETVVESNPQLMMMFKGKNVSRIRDFLLNFKEDKGLRDVDALLKGKKVQRVDKAREMLKAIEEEASEDTPEERLLKEKLSLKGVKKKNNIKKEHEELEVTEEDDATLDEISELLSRGGL